MQNNVNSDASITLNVTVKLIVFNPSYPNKVPCKLKLGILHMGSSNSSDLWQPVYPAQLFGSAMGKSLCITITTVSRQNYLKDCKVQPDELPYLYWPGYDNVKM